MIERSSSGVEANDVLARLPEVYALINGYPGKMTANEASGTIPYENGSIEPFNGYDLKILQRRISAVAEFDARSREEIAHGITDPLIEIANKYGIQIKVPGRGDLPSHATIQTGDFPAGADSALTVSTTSELTKPDSGLWGIAEELVDTSVALDHLVLAGSMLYVCTSDPTRDAATFGSVFRFLKARDGIRNVFESAKAPLEVPTGSRTYATLIHSTVGRITGVSNTSNLAGFANEVRRSIGEPLNTNPVFARVGSVRIESAYDQMLRGAPHLIKR